MLLNVYGEAIIWEEDEVGIRIGGSTNSELRYRDDTVLITLRAQRTILYVT